MLDAAFLITAMNIYNITRWTFIGIILHLLFIVHTSLGIVDQGNKIFLIEASKQNNIPIIEWLLDLNATIDVKDENGWTPIMHAAQNENSTNTIKFLVERGADPEVANDEGITAAHLAAMKGNNDALSYFNEHGANLVVKDGNGRSPLFMAASEGHIDTVSLLLDIEGDPLSTDKNGLTPIHEAAIQGQKLVLELFNNRGLNLSIVNEEDGTTAIILASLFNKYETVKYLLESGADIETCNDEGWSPLHAASYSGNINTVKMLVERNATIDKRNKNGQTPLFLAVQKGHVDVTEYLINKQAQLIVTDGEGNTLLHASADSGSPKIIKIVASEHVSLNLKNSYGLTPLMVASIKGNFAAVKLLIKLGANKKEQDKNRATVVHAAASSCNVDIIKLFHDLGMNMDEVDVYFNTPLHFSADRGCTSIIEFLVENLANQLFNRVKNSFKCSHAVSTDNCMRCYKAIVNVRNVFGVTPIYTLAKNGYLDGLKYLIEKGGNINITDNNGTSPFHAAAANGKLEILKYLALQNLNINSRNKDLMTPLFLASKAGQLEAVHFLLENGADPMIGDNKGQTNLHVAVILHNLDLVNELVRFKGLIDSYDNNNKTPAWWAARQGDTDTLSILLRHGAEKSSSVMMAAVISGRLDTLRYLVWNGGNPNSIFNGTFLIQEACIRGFVDITEFLMNNGETVNVKSQNGESLLHFSVLFPGTYMIDYILNKGLCIDVSDKFGNTPLHTAAKNNMVPAIAHLLSKGADVNKKNIFDETPVDVADKYSSNKARELLLANGAVLTGTTSTTSEPFYYGTSDDSSNSNDYNYY